MKKFIAVFTGTVESRKAKGWDDLSDSERDHLEQQGMRAWGKWMQDNAEIILDAGGPLGGTKSASKDGIVDTNNNLCGYVVFQAESHDAAVKYFDGHPHFSIFPGDSVEVMECLPMPG